jgi:hypothetical protein
VLLFGGLFLLYKASRDFVEVEARRQERSPASTADAVQMRLLANACFGESSGRSRSSTSRVLAGLRDHRCRHGRPDAVMVVVW